MSEPNNSPITAWLPEQDRHRLAVLGKLVEELNECSARAARCIIHGLEETDPDTGRLNRFELEREIADVLACIDQAVSRLDIRIRSERRQEKSAGFDRWHGLIEDAESSCCIACDQPLMRGQMVLSDASGGLIHVDCCGPERESYTGPDGEPLKEGEPIPTGFAWGLDHAS